MAEILAERVPASGGGDSPAVDTQAGTMEPGIGAQGANSGLAPAPAPPPRCEQDMRSTAGAAEGLLGWLCLFFAAVFTREWPPIPWLRIDEWKGEICARCGDSGFSGWGTGYDAVCSECGGQSASMSGHCEALHAGWLAFTEAAA